MKFRFAPRLHAQGRRTLYAVSFLLLVVAGPFLAHGFAVLSPAPALAVVQRDPVADEAAADTVIQLRIDRDGFALEDAVVPEGTYLIALHNSTGLDEDLEVTVTRSGREREPLIGTMKKGHDYQARVTFEKDEVITLTEASHPNWIGTITVAP